MGRKFKLNKDYYDEGVELFNKTEIEFNPGLTVLVGCNGAGKSTLINHLRYNLSLNDIPHLKYDNLVNGGNIAREDAMKIGDMKKVILLSTSSEGENILINFGDFIEKVGRKVKWCIENNEKELWILCDAVDSGFSIDNIIQFKSVCSLILKDAKNLDVYIIAAANSYEMANSENCLDVYNGKYRTFKSYNTYKNFILKSAEVKMKRLES